MTSTASSSISSLVSTGGQRWPRMCSFRASPEPTPKTNLPVEQELRGCGGLGQDRRVDPDRGAGDARRDLV